MCCCAIQTSRNAKDAEEVNVKPLVALCMENALLLSCSQSDYNFERARSKTFSTAGGRWCHGAFLQRAKIVSKVAARSIKQ